nr:DUF3883 domain-containing protein [Solimonas marina]
MPKQLQKDFRSWFASITEGRIGTEQIHLLTLKETTKERTKHNAKRRISPSDLAARLAAQNRIGAIGEEIALAHEKNRLKDLGANAQTMDVIQVSLLNVAAGFDIRSRFKKDLRHIEVKASTSIDGPLFISPNELSTLQNLGASAYLYMVHVTNVKKREGRVVKVIRDPFNRRKSKAWLAPCLFTGRPPDGDPQDAG